MPEYTAAQTATIFIYGSIDAQPAEELTSILTSQLKKEVKHLHFMLCTSGGSVAHGIALYNLLQALPYDITMHNISNVDSIGNVVFLAGKQRYATPNATFMLHPLKTEMASRNTTINTIYEKFSSLEMDDKRIKGIFFQNTSIPQKDLNKLFRTGEVKSADYALEIGLIHEIREMKLDMDSQIIVLECKPQED